MNHSSTSSEAPLMLSISGARGIVGQTMTAEVAYRFARSFGSIVRDSSGVASPLLLVGRDSRPSGAELLLAACEGLISAGCRAIHLGIAMTPSVGVMIDEHKAQGGMVITASHNPIQWNGLKCLNADGVAPPKELAEQIIERFLKAGPARGNGTPQSIDHDNRSNEVHVGRVLQAIGNQSVAAIIECGFKVVVDSVCGAGGPAASSLLNRLGCEVVHLHAEPTGQFPHAPEPLQENLGVLMESVTASRAAIGFAQDPDADRLAIIDEDGRFIGEEYTLALCAQRVLERHLSDERSHLHQSICLATNLSTSRMIDDVAASFENVHVLRTAVGEANVVAAMKPRGSSAILGGEGNGGVILPTVCWVRDSLSSMALVLDLLASRDESLSAIVDSLPSYVMIKQKFDLSAVGGRDVVDDMMDRVKNTFANERINDSDGVRVDFADGWVHLRPSNTEPIVRLIGEAETEAQAKSLLARVANIAEL